MRFLHLIVVAIHSQLAYFFVLIDFQENTVIVKYNNIISDLSFIIP